MVGIQRPDLAGRLEGSNAYRKQVVVLFFKDEAYRPRVSDSDYDHGREALETIMQSILTGDQ